MAHVIVTVTAIICVSVLAALGQADSTLVGTVFGASLGFSASTAGRRRADDFPQQVPGGQRRTDPPPVA